MQWSVAYPGPMCQGRLQAGADGRGGNGQATFGVGVLLGVEAALRQVPGVIDAVAGYAGGTVANLSYEQVCTARTGMPRWFRSSTTRRGSARSSCSTCSSPNTTRPSSTARGRMWAPSTAR
jgi:hypothetical protein